MKIPTKHIEQTPFWMWGGGIQKTETSLNVECARKLGFAGKTPRYELGEYSNKNYPKTPGVVVGIGYQKSTVYRDWSDKHFGDKAYASIIAALARKGIRVTLVGSKEDLASNGENIIGLIRDKYKLDGGLFKAVLNNFTNACGKYDNLEDTIRLIAGNTVYVGNESGLGIVSAACNLKTIFLYTKEQKEGNWPFWRNIPENTHHKWMFNPSLLEVVDVIADRL
jgi:ADP-heptose:LPS heptosyltransferase